MCRQLRVTMAALALATTLALAIYPNDHWKYSTKLTEANFESQVKHNVDAGKTFIVRWIASEG